MIQTLSKNLVPNRNFLLKRVIDGYWDIFDIKLPDKSVIVGSDPRRRFSSYVDSAISQVNEYRDYFDDPQNRAKIEKSCWNKNLQTK